ncbi:glutaredoxin family protein [Tetragenococcus osmophilus]|uniref:Glutaredoxin family protein n=1 Tax=Tetragenococcus osmophilus TaxID=526944 RepID=A0AA37XHR8_9ENTE|nr:MULTISPECIES: glutaredoxin family protein [Tetragenococcus]AYW47023.1 glutaredoxin family protein [Tetragenococcus osmophilus]GMA46680.1 hypothetical protein GCM10025854_09300 [Tetragenococcus muriaticus]GMA55081.1 hypothetical protein GCM10025857_64380 [Alicyclobacillus contaminans]GMA71143.1 hypothetical protein GCM10025885_01920 [Tetragenococcus osmophilus]
MAKYELEIYTRPTCSDCQNLKHYLTVNDIPFQSHDVESNPEQEKELVTLTGNRIVPAIVFKKRGLLKKQEVFVGFEPNRIQIEELTSKVRN